MASIPFTLAALATSAVPDLEVVGVYAHDTDEDFAAAVIATDRGELLVRVPRSAAAEVRQSAELLGLAALSPGSRALLPFEVPESLGMTRAGETRAVISTFLTGGRFDATDLRDDALLILAIAEALAAIHDLPSSIAQQGGLPTRSARDLRLQATRLIDRADATRLLPKTVRQKWMRTLEAAELWDFAPTMVHGAFSAERLIVDEDRITGVEGWQELSIGDPATDFSWLLEASQEVLETVLSRYSKLRSAGSMPSLKTRAVLYRELEIARWLLHGVESHDQQVIDDAVAMLDRLVDGLATTIPLTERPVLNENQVAAMLEETPEVVDLMSDTAAYEALDEDRMFGFEASFVEHDDDSASNSAAADDSAADGAAAAAAAAAGTLGTDGSAADNAGAGGNTDGDTADRSGADSTGADGSATDEQITEPISDTDLPR